MAKEARHDKKKRGRGGVIRITQTSRPTLKIVSAIDGMTKKWAACKSFATMREP